jgi:hypothetical protein
MTIMTMKTESNAPRKTAIRGIGVVLGASVLGALFSAQANAACVDPNAGQGSQHQSPKLALDAPSVQNFWGHDDAAHKMVGTWQVSYAAGGSVYGVGFIQWHSDGTEWENIDFPVLGGNLCLGSWKVVGEDRVYRYHVGWLYTDGIVSGHFVETETDVVSRDGNSYSGNNDTKFYQLDGTMFREVVGTSAATRIAP